MGDEGDYWRDVAPHMKEESQRKRASNREASARSLIDAGIHFDARNGGAHLIVYAANMVVDFWPGTGLWIARGTKKRQRGVRRLIAELRNQRDQTNET
jgi:hypothetical protein